MCEDECQCYLESDEYTAYMQIEEQIGHCSPERAWAMYCISAGVVRENITLAVMEQIAKGNKALLAEFHEFAPAGKRDHTSG